MLIGIVILGSCVVILKYNNILMLLVIKIERLQLIVKIIILTARKVSAQ